MTFQTIVLVQGLAITPYLIGNVELTSKNTLQQRLGGKKSDKQSAKFSGSKHVFLKVFRRMTKNIYADVTSKWGDQKSFLVYQNNSSRRFSFASSCITLDASRQARLNFVTTTRLTVLGFIATIQHRNSWLFGSADRQDKIL